MKPIFFILFCLFTSLTWAQNVEVDARLYTPQELIEEVLIDSECISNVVVTNAVSGDFNGNDLSYGYFEANNASFPFQNGIVLSTGRLANTAGPNTTLSDDDAPNWNGDSDLETVLNETNTLNATILEFEFEAIADQISFRYIFASEEYQEGNANTCQYSDLFGFLIRPVNQSSYTNIAVVPNTNTPIKVTTVHPGIPNSCAPINPRYFGSWNGPEAPINFNGQTDILTAVANVVPNTRYHVKLVIADEQNYRYDSAVYLEAGSFQLRSNLGRDLLIADNSALCTDQTIELNAFQPGNNTYRWFRNGLEITNESGPTYTVTEAGTYEVEVIIDGRCLSTGQVTIEYDTNPVVSNTTLVACDWDLNGRTTYNLFDAEPAIVNGNTQLDVNSFYETFSGAEQGGADRIANPTNYISSGALQPVYARVNNANGCVSVAEVTLDIADNIIDLASFSTCDTDNDGVETFSISELEAHVLAHPDVPNSAFVSFYPTQNDLENQQNEILGSYSNTTSPNLDVLYLQITNNNQCFAFTSLTLNISKKPELPSDETVFYCLNKAPLPLSLSAGLTDNLPNNYSYQWFFNGADLMQNTSLIQINNIGTYTVTVTNTAGCASTRIISVLPSNLPTIEDIAIMDASSNNSVTITVSGDGTYEYALDFGTFQNSPTFYNVSAGLHSITVNDVNGCGFVSKEISVLGFPKFFTPNGDGMNDMWRPIGLNPRTAQMQIAIFNRYGKLIKQLNRANAAWNGTYEGQLLGADDYWFRATLPNGKIYTGHFSLVR
ncbi:choice-of-anchor L domain-containing protein [Bizionia sediminis]|uniref:Choice-of-anchor L domain-containing protein n=1 Tax=Bizionia sediminis TaxID=1737064 RepID=A0ABW5KPN1_9FLAO